MNECLVYKNVSPGCRCVCVGRVDKKTMIYHPQNEARSVGQLDGNLYSCGEDVCW